MAKDNTGIWTKRDLGESGGEWNWGRRHGHGNVEGRLRSRKHALGVYVECRLVPYFTSRWLSQVADVYMHLHIRFLVAKDRQTWGKRSVFVMRKSGSVFIFGLL